SSAAVRRIATSPKIAMRRSQINGKSSLNRQESKRLSQAYIELPGVITRPLVERNRHIQPQRPETGVVTKAQTSAVAQIFAKIGIGGVIDVAGVDEGDDSETLADAQAQFQAGFEQAAPTLRIAGFVQRA